MSASTTRHAEVSGGGISGLSAAAALAQHGWSVRVHERSPELREIGAAVVLYGNGLTAIKEIGAFEDAIEHGSKLVEWDTRDERLRFIQRGAVEGDAYCVARPDLLAALAKVATEAGVEIVTDSRVAGADPDGYLILADGQRLKADMVIGADGVHSPVRDSMRIDVKKTELNVGAQRLFVPRRPEDPKAAMPEWWHGPRRVGANPCGDLLYIYMFCPPTDTVGRREPFDRESWSADFPQMRSAFARMPDETDWREITDVRCSSWIDGRIVIIGDAAHSMAPNLGMGACQSLESAVTLGQALGRSTDELAALREWEAWRRPAATKVQRLATLYHRIVNNWPKPIPMPIRSVAAWALAKTSLGTSPTKRESVAA